MYLPTNTFYVLCKIFDRMLDWTRDTAIPHLGVLHHLAAQHFTVLHNGPVWNCEICRNRTQHLRSLGMFRKICDNTVYLRDSRWDFFKTELITIKCYSEFWCLFIVYLYKVYCKMSTVQYCTTTFFEEKFCSVNAKQMNILS